MDFKAELIVYVLPHSIRDQNTNEFSDIHLGPGMSVSEYEEKFKKLSRYAPDDCRGEEALSRKF